MAAAAGRGRVGGLVSNKLESAEDFRVFRTLMSMLFNRGYEVDEGLRTMDKVAFDAEFCPPSGGRAIKERLNRGFRMRDEEEHSLLVVWVPGVKVGVKPIREFGERLADQGFKRGILIIERALSPFGKQAVAMMKPILVEYFSYAELKFDITTHKLVPKHRVLAPEEKRVLLESKKLKEHQLPRMLVSDPVSRYYGLEKGQIVEITRNSDTIGTYVSYRIVVPS